MVNPTRFSNSETKKKRPAPTRAVARKPARIPVVIEDDNEHSAIGASGAYRWLECPGSVAAQEGKPNLPNWYAAQGTVAHHIFNECLTENFLAKDFIGREYSVRSIKHPELIFDFVVDDEMARAVQFALNEVANIVDELREQGAEDIQVYGERGFDLSWLEPGMWGTADVVIYAPGVALIVLDYKHGIGDVIEAEENSQGVYYLIGAARELRTAGVKTFRFGILQPRAKHEKGFARYADFSPARLKEWAARLRDGARATKIPGAPRKAGGHCKYCVDKECHTRAEFALAVAQSDFTKIAPVSPHKLTPEQVAFILDNSKMLRDYLDDVAQHAHRLLECGAEIPGYTRKEKLGNRKWRTDISEAKLVSALKKITRWDSDDLFDRVLMSPSAIEKAIPKESREKLAQLYIREANGFSIVRDENASDETNSATADFTPVTAKTIRKRPRIKSASQDDTSFLD